MLIIILMFPASWQDTSPIFSHFTRSLFFLGHNVHYVDKVMNLMWWRFAQRKALAKTASWRGLSFMGTTRGVWGITGRPTLAAAIGLAEVFVKSLGYYLHECVWEWAASHRAAGLPFFTSLRARVGRLAEESSTVQPRESIG